MYTTHTKYTYDEYKKYSEFNIHSRLRRLVSLFLILPMVAFLYVCFRSGKYVMLAMVLVILLLCCFVINKKIKTGIKQAWDSNKSIQNVNVQIVFDESGWQVTDQHGSCTYRYDDVFKIVETDTNFYIYTAMNVAVIVVKANCSEELTNFIRKIKK